MAHASERRRETAFSAIEVRRAKFTIWVNAACCFGWVWINVAAAWLLKAPRILGLSGAALAMIVCWAFALRDLDRAR